MAEETAVVVEQQTPEASVGESHVSFEQFSRDRKEGKIDATAGGEEHSPGGDQWDVKKNKWGNPTRDDQGRFAKVKESLAKALQKGEYVRALQQGAVQPSEEMDADTWVAARNAQIKHGTDRITPPELSSEENPESGKAAEAKPSGEPAEQQLTPEEITEIEGHQAFMSAVAAKVAFDPETKAAIEGFREAYDKGTAPGAINYMSLVISGTPNPHEVFQALGKNPEAIAMYSSLSPHAMQQVIQAVSKEIASKQAAAQVHARPPKPQPPTPVGARQATSHFDVNDESTDVHEWARQRTKQLAERRR
jgi:hypothetical protein